LRCARILQRDQILERHAALRLGSERHVHGVVKQIELRRAPLVLVEDHVERERLGGERGFDAGKIVGGDLLRGRLDDGYVLIETIPCPVGVSRPALNPSAADQNKP
jgi:hypothetical protein